jgi:hypothetical protein
MCEYCNPLGLADPAASQAHGTVFLAIGVAVVLLAFLGRLLLTGIGPFDARVSGVAVATDGSGAASGLSIVLTVTNRGSHSGASTCRVHDRAIYVNDVSAIFLSPEIAAGTTATFTRTTSLLGHQPSGTLEVECGQP